MVLCVVGYRCGNAGAIGCIGFLAKEYALRRSPHEESAGNMHKKAPHPSG
ncbi:MAG: hypothetical protein QXN87_07190 [Candidatus Bathyarchaeia archaeon]